MKKIVNAQIYMHMTDINNKITIQCNWIFTFPLIKNHFIPFSKKQNSHTNFE